MPKLTADFKKQIKALPKEDLEKIVTKWAGRDKIFHESLIVNFLNPDFGEQDLFEQYRTDLDRLTEKQYPGRSESIRLVKMMKASFKVVNTFKKSVKTPNLEVELYLHILDFQFAMASDYLGSYYQMYDNTLARTVKKVITIVTDKLHEDYLLEYQGKLNGYLLTLHRLAPFNPIVRELPRKIGA